MRVTGGVFRSRELRAPKGSHTRPTSDRVREALFSILGARGVFDEPCRALDLYAGTGALGLEALSRGVSHVTFVEQDRAALSALAANVDSLKVRDQVTVLGCAVAAALATVRRGPPVDLIFADPPYAMVPTGEVARALEGYVPLLAPYGVLVLEHSEGDAPPPLRGLTLVSTRRYGDTSVTLYEPAKDGSMP